jgi:hypothetical protein
VRNQFEYGLGWIPDLPDIRDFSTPLRVRAPAGFPQAVDLRDRDWSVPFQQGATNSCTGHAVAFLFEAVHRRQTNSSFVASPSFIYWNARVIDRAQNVDNGASIRHGMRSVNVMGTCARDEWPLQYGVLVEPELACFGAAIEHKAIEYHRLVRDIEVLRGNLARGSPFVFGFTVYESIERAKATGDIDLPGSNERLIGGHAVVAIGYHDVSSRFLIRNSWGDWGAAGYGTIPYEYLSNPNLTDDFWVMSAVTASLRA